LREVGAGFYEFFVETVNNFDAVEKELQQRTKNN
jgi:hypothetical protein